MSKRRYGRREEVRATDAEAEWRHKKAYMLRVFKKLVGFGAVPGVTGVVLLILYFTAGCGGLDCGANGQCVGGLTSAACLCEGNYAGKFCEGHCGESGRHGRPALL